jgi:hypothetical protein
MSTDLHEKMKKRDTALGAVLGGATGALVSKTPAGKALMGAAGAGIGAGVGRLVGDERAAKDKTKHERHTEERERSQEHRKELIEMRKKAAVYELPYEALIAYNELVDRHGGLTKLTPEQIAPHIKDAPTAKARRHQAQLAHGLTGAIVGGFAGSTLGAVGEKLFPRHIPDGVGSLLGGAAGATLGGIGGGVRGGKVENKNMTHNIMHLRELAQAYENAKAEQPKQASLSLDAISMAAMSDELGHLKVAINIAPLAAIGTKVLGAARAAAPKVLGAVDNVGAKVVSGLERAGGAGLSAANPLARGAGQGVISGLNRAETALGGVKNLNRAAGGLAVGGGALATMGAARALTSQPQPRARY